MKILYIVTQADLGGAQKSVLLLAKHFNGLIAAGEAKNELFEEANKHGIASCRLKYLTRGVSPIFDLLSIFEIYRLVKKIKPDIVHLNSSKAGFVGSIAAKLAGAKVIFTARGFVFNEPHSPFVKYILIGLEKFASLFRDQIITVSEFDRQSALKHHLINPEKISTIHNAIPQIEFLTKAEAQNALSLQKDKFAIGTIANFYKTKGLDVFVQAVAKLGSEVKNKIQVTIIGEGPEDSELKSLIQKYNLENIFNLAGQKQNASQYLKTFDLFVLPSRKEGFPLVLLEAMQAELPIIASDVGGNKEALEDAGTMVETENPKDLARAISLLVTDSAIRESRAARTSEQTKKFTLENLYSQMEMVYKKL